MWKNFDPILKVMLERRKLLENWRTIVKKMAAAFKEILPDAEVYVFGSVIEGRATGGSDVDVLVVSDMIPKVPHGRAEVKVAVIERLGLPLHHPFEIHIVSRDEAEWYRKHVKKLIRIL